MSTECYTHQMGTHYLHARRITAGDRVPFGSPDSWRAVIVTTEATPPPPVPENRWKKVRANWTLGAVMFNFIVEEMLDIDAVIVNNQTSQEIGEVAS